MNNQTYTTYQAAESLGLSIRRVQALISTGLINANKNGRDWEIPESEIERFKHQERSVGRPPKNRSEVDRAFQNTPSEVYNQVVEIIKILVDREGLNAAYSAFAEATWRRIETEVMKGFKRKGLSHVCIYRLLGKKRCPDSYDHPCDSPNIPGQDHLSEWTKDGRTNIIISQPYGLSYEDMKKMVEFCENRGLRADIEEGSWHFPGRTIKIDITLNNK